MKLTSTVSTIAAAVLSIAAIPPLFSPAPPQVTTEDLTVTATVTDSLGVPWPTSVELLISITNNADNNADSITTCPKAVPNSLGEVTVTVPIEAGILDGSEVQLEIMGTPGPFFLTGPGAFFLNPIQGEACIHSGIKPQLQSSTNSYVADFKSSSLGLPPVYGSLSLSSQHGQQLSVSVMDFDPNGALNSEYFALGCLPQLLPTGQSLVEIYRWNLSGAAWVSVSGPNGSNLASGILRRDSTLALTPSREVSVNVSVDQGAYPTAKRFLIVKASDHVPNAQNPNGSNVSYHQQRKRSILSRPVKAHHESAPTGIEVFDFYMGGGNYVLELWSAPTGNSGSRTRSLLSYQAFTSPTANQTIVLD